MPIFNINNAYNINHAYNINNAYSFITTINSYLERSLSRVFFQMTKGCVICYQGSIQWGGGGVEGTSPLPNFPASPPNVTCCGDLETKLKLVCALEI